MTSNIGMPAQAEWIGVAFLDLVIFGLPLLAIIAILGGKRVRRFLPFAACALALVVAAILMVLIVRTNTRGLARARMQARETARNHVELEHPQGLPPEERAVEDWTPSAEHPFLADVYPTLRSAAIGMSRISMEKWLQTKPCRRIIISGNVSSDLKKEVAAKAIAPLIEHRSPGIDVDINPDGAPKLQTQPAEVTTLNLVHLPARHEPGDPSEPVYYLTVSLTWHDGSTSTSQVKIANEPWCEDFDRWSAKQPGHTWLIAHSGQLCSTSSEALEQALKRAAVKIQRRIAPDLFHTPRHIDALFSSPGSVWLNMKIVSELRNGTFEKRTFSQRLHRPYGNIWRCAVLVDASPDRLTYLKGEYLSHVQSWRTGWMSTSLSAFGLLAVILVVYLFLNAATKGYYVWSIRGAAVVLAAAGIGFVLFLV